MKVRKPFVLVAIAIASAAGLAALETSQTWARFRSFGNEFDWLKGFRETLTVWLAVVALAPAVFAMARRYRIQRGRNVLRHVLAALVFAFTASLVAGTVIALQHPELRFLFIVGKVTMFSTIYYFILYWAIVGLAHMLAAAQLEERLTRERLEVLRTKLNPHFLFNTLNAISTMSLQRDHQGVVQALALVSDLLRVSLDDSLPQEIPLRRELELTDKYLEVQRLRFGERLRVERDIDPATAGVLVPSMLLQPIVENAIVHGVAAVPGEGMVRLSAHREGDLLRIVVADSGPGFQGDRKGIGLANTRERLAGLYGDRASLDVENAAGAVVSVTIPAREQS